jgi:hypothetical protein
MRGLESSSSRLLFRRKPVKIIRDDRAQSVDTDADRAYLAVAAGLQTLAELPERLVHLEELVTSPQQTEAERGPCSAR